MITHTPSFVTIRCPLSADVSVMFDDGSSFKIQNGFRYVDVGRELSRALLDLSERERARRARRLLEELAGNSAPVVVLDNIEVLFDVTLRMAPLACLQSIARNRTIVAAWNGEVAEGHLTYAVPDHPEFKRYPVAGLLIVGTSVDTKVC